MRKQLQAYYEKHHRYMPLYFFVGGFLFDVLTLSQIDDLLSLIQQGVYLTLCFVLLGIEFLEKENRMPIPRRLEKVWNYRQEALHFLLGSMLSIYTLFYFKSSTLWNAWAFILLLAFLLVANEIPRFQKFGAAMRMGLSTLCLISFLLILVPVSIGHMGPWTFVLSIALALLLLRGIFLIYQKKLKIQEITLKKSVRWPYLTVLSLIVLLYFLRVLPPIPLSATFAGIYYNIEKVDGKYELSYNRPKWRFWQKSTSTVQVTPGQKIYCFAQIFSPARFKDQLNFRWMRKNTLTSSWEQWDLIPMQIIGGREDGFRGYTMKSNFDVGHWRVQIESLDGREISRVYFDVVRGNPSTQLELEKVSL